MQNQLNEDQVRQALEQLEEAIGGGPVEVYGVDYRDIEEDEEVATIEANQRGFLRIAIEIARASLTVPIDEVRPTQDLNAHQLRMYLHRFANGETYDAFKNPPAAKGWGRFVGNLFTAGCLIIALFLFAMMCVGLSTIFGGCGKP